MKKTLIAMTLAALPVASMAEVVLYGQIKGGVETTKVKGVKGTTTQIVDYGSRIGFKGQEQLNNSLKAIWQLEQRVDIGGGSTTRGFGTRDSFIGLQGGFGTVKVGYFGDPVHNVNGDLDQWEYHNDAAGLGKFTRGTDGSARRVAVGYQTPDMGGFTAKAYVSPSDNNKWSNESTKDKRTPDRAVYGAGASYKNSGFFADLAGTYIKNGANNAELKKDSDWKKKHAYQAIAQVGYDANNWLVGVAYQVGRNVDKGIKINETDTTYHQIARSQEVATSVAYTIDNALTLKGTAAYGFGLKGYTVSNETKNSVADGTALEKTFGNGKYIQGILGADYNLSKRTTLNGQVGYLQFGKKDYNKREGTIGVGLKHKF